MNPNPSSATGFLKRSGLKTVVGLLVLMALTLIAGIYIGRYMVTGAAKDAYLSRQSQLMELSALRKELDTALGEVQIHRTQHEVDSRALDIVRNEMAVEKARTADLEEGLLFYRSMVVSNDVASGISLRPPELVRGESEGYFTYRIFVQQRVREQQMVKGTLAVEVHGVQGDEDVSYPLAELSQSLSEATVALQFRYFQVIEGELVLPAGFEPRSISVVARTSKPREVTVTEQYPWEWQERFIHVGE